ncbi:hypothetical protein [Roseisalinus antarcticus]|uniref:Uncharacterized protein n=1 Tax=Roseisalinus antarcticus TaxID=254357 RepID=A0A1Y5U2D7_9RHOB|nr:hypothetical protein [Roseisalinus antarcticus]SLN75057.1 hypothetical protein ROA7023_03884 [Roseisalinus antarcticus]
MTVQAFRVAGQTMVLLPHVDTTLTPSLALSVTGTGTQTVNIRREGGADLA